MNRQTIREQTMQLIFQMDAKNDFDYTNLNLIDENAKVLKQSQAIETLEAIKNHLEEIDSFISNNLEKWNFERIAKTDLSILRNAVAEMLYCENIPNSVAINEAVNLAKKFGDEKSYAFINSVLSKISKSL